MQLKIQFSLVLIFAITVTFAQDQPFNRLDFLIGAWEGTGSGFGNERSRIESDFQLVMNKTFMEVRNESVFEPTESNPEGDKHLDQGYISYDKSRKLFVFRQFNNEGYINQYVLVDSLSSESTLVFETEVIENFLP